MGRSIRSNSDSYSIYKQIFFKLINFLSVVKHSIRLMYTIHICFERELIVPIASMFQLNSCKIPLILFSMFSVNTIKYPNQKLKNYSKNGCVLFYRTEMYEFHT